MLAEIVEAADVDGGADVTVLGADVAAAAVVSGAALVAATLVDEADSELPEHAATSTPATSVDTPTQTRPTLIRCDDTEPIQSAPVDRLSAPYWPGHGQADNLSRGRGGVAT